MRIHLWNKDGSFWWLDEDHRAADGPGHNGNNIAAGPFLDPLNATLDANDIAGALAPVKIIGTTEPANVEYPE